MPPDLHPPSLDPITRALIRAKARQLACRLGLSAADRPDVEQDLTVHVWERLARFDPDRADREVFVRMLVGHAAATALRGRRCRARRAARSFETVLADREPVDPRAGPERAIALTLDVETVLAAVPPSLRQVARAVGTGSVVAAARHLGISRSTLYRRLRDLRAAFEAAGFADGPAGSAGRGRRGG